MFLKGRTSYLLIILLTSWYDEVIDGLLHEEITYQKKKIKIKKKERKLSSKYQAWEIKDLESRKKKKEVFFFCSSTSHFKLAVQIF